MATSAKARREQLRRELFGSGLSAREVAVEIGIRLHVRPRVAWRYAMGWPQWKLVQEFRSINPHLPIGENRVSEWESWPFGGSRPSLEILAALAEAFGKGCAVTDLLDDADLTNMTPAERRLLVSSGDATEQSLSSETAPLTNDQFQARLNRMETAYDTLPAGSLLGDAATLLAHAQTSSLNGAASRQRLVAQAQAATLLGKIVWDASQRQDRTSTRRYFTQASAVAAQAGDPVTEASAVLRTCYVALYSDKDPADALQLAWRTTDLAEKTSNVLAGLGLLHAAESLALLGAAPEAERALIDADTRLAGASADDPAADWFTPGTLDRMAGSVYLSLGDGVRSQRILEGALIGIRPGSKSQAIVTGNIVLALIQQSQPDQAAVVLGQAIDIIETTRGGGGMAVAFQAGRELARWRDVSEVQDVRERLLSLIAA